MKLFYTLVKPGLLLFAVLLFYNCEALLETDLPDDKMNREGVFQDLQTTHAVLTRLYINARENPLFKGGLSGLGADMAKYTDELDSYSAEDVFYRNGVLPSNNQNNRYWERAYVDVYVINAFIEGINSSKAVTAADKTVLLGEAYFLRALYYHYLTQLYGDIPYITGTDYKANTTIRKTPYTIVLEKVEADLKTSLNLLENPYRHSDRIFPNQAVVHLLLAKNYLLQKRYDLAVVHAQEVMANPLYALENDVNQVFKKDARSTLWQMSPSANLNPTPEASDYIFTSLPPTRAALSPNILGTFDSQDLRLQEWTKEVTNGPQSYSHVYKYKNNGSNTDEFSIVFRLEEAYFIKAEALGQQEQIGDAVEILNAIRSKRGLLALPSNLNNPTFITELLAEYQREFFTEGGHRFFDLKRLGHLNLLEQLKPNWEAKHALLPLPERELLLNENLKPQNDGY